MTVLAIGLAAGTAGCQTMSDLDPTGLLGGGDSVPESQFPTESAQQAEHDANTTTPDLASIPARPAPPDTAAQANTTQQVTAAGAQAQYSADALRAGTDAAAPPPVATDANATKQALASVNAPPTASDTPPSASDLPPSASDAPPTAGSAPIAAPPPRAASAPSAPPVRNTGGRAAVAPLAVASAAPPPEAPGPSAPPSVQNEPPPSAVQTVPLAPLPRGTEPAVPAVPGAPGVRTAMINPSDAELGFKPSSAPPLNPSVAQWVSPPILAHYRQTAAQAGSAGTGSPAVPAVPAARGRGQAAGDVVADLNTAPGTPTGMSAAMNGGVAPTEIIYFPGDSTSLPATARDKVREAVAAFRAGGGTVKVIGHASSRTGNMTVERHLEVIFQKSQARANAVAQALIKAGVPADKVQIEAVGDSQPIYYESMPKGEEGNRRAEIFVQS
jgi:outer membrane protein OmpA-like peptidoglycan-associated protein